MRSTKHQQRAETLRRREVRRNKYAPIATLVA